MFASLPSLAQAALSAPFKRSQLGLFHGKMKQYGNNSKRLFSETLGENVRVKVTTRALKTIKKYGGLDQYVMKTKTDLLGWEGMRLRILVREAQERKVNKASPPIL